jgi:aspartate kinase
VGLGMANQAGVADRMFRALADAEINIEAITTSQIKVSVLVKRDKAMAALRAVHGEFELQKPPAERMTYEETVAAARDADAVAVIDRLQHMEDLTIEGISLDETQARFTISEVPDRPGIVADIFEAVAAEGILVDMIVQSVGRDGFANVSFTVPRTDVDKTQMVVDKLAEEIGGKYSHESAVDILSVRGIGIRSHTGVGIRMFHGLAEAGINVDMINSSEVRINAVVTDDKGNEGLKALNQVFADVLE